MDSDIHPPSKTIDLLIIQIADIQIDKSTHTSNNFTYHLQKYNLVLFNLVI